MQIYTKFSIIHVLNSIIVFLLFLTFFQANTSSINHVTQVVQLYYLGTFLFSTYLFDLSYGPVNTVNVGPDLGPNCLQRLSADDKSHH